MTASTVLDTAEVEKRIIELLDEMIGDKQYTSIYPEGFSLDIRFAVMNQMKKMGTTVNPKLRFIVFAHIDPVPIILGLNEHRIQTICNWQKGVDKTIRINYNNESLICTVIVFIVN